MLAKKQLPHVPLVIPVMVGSSFLHLLLLLLLLTVELDDAVRLPLRVLGQAPVGAKVPPGQVADAQGHLGAVEGRGAGLLRELVLAPARGQVRPPAAGASGGPPGVHVASPEDERRRVRGHVALQADGATQLAAHALVGHPHGGGNLVGGGGKEESLLLTFS